MRRFALLLVLLSLVPLVAAAQPAQPGQSLDEPFGTTQNLTVAGLANAIVRLGLFLVIIAAAIYIAIGAYAYFAAAGNAKMAQQGQEIIQRSIIGLILGLLAWVLLNTISPQFTELREPSLGLGGREGLARLPEFPQPRLPMNADANVGELPNNERTRLLYVRQTGPDTFLFVRDANPQSLNMDGVLRRADSLIQGGVLRPGDGVIINVPQNVTPTPRLYEQLSGALSTRRLSLGLPHEQLR